DVLDGHAPPAQQGIVGVEQGRLLEALLQSRSVDGVAVQSLHVTRVLEAGHELDLAKLCRLEATRRASSDRKVRKSWGAMVSSTPTCSTSKASITLTRLR